MIGAIPPVPHMPSWRADRQSYRYVYHYMLLRRSNQDSQTGGTFNKHEGDEKRTQTFVGKRENADGIIIYVITGCAIKV